MRILARQARRFDWLRALGLTLAALVSVDVHELLAQEVAIPVDVHVPLLMKILNYDRSLPDKVHGEVTVGLLYQSGYRTSANVADEVRAAVAQLPEDILGGFPVHLVTIDLDKTEDLGKALADLRLHVLYVTPMRAVDLAMVLRASQVAQILTMTGVPQYVETGVAIGIDRRGERAQIVVNIAASRAEGADLSAQLLKLARVVKPKGR